VTGSFLSLARISGKLVFYSPSIVLLSPNQPRVTALLFPLQVKKLFTGLPLFLPSSLFDLAADHLSNILFFSERSLEDRQLGLL
jgi:hypothetical protein